MTDVDDETISCNMLIYCSVVLEKERKANVVVELVMMKECTEGRAVVTEHRMVLSEPKQIEGEASRMKMHQTIEDGPG